MFLLLLFIFFPSFCFAFSSADIEKRLKEHEKYFYAERQNKFHLLDQIEMKASDTKHFEDICITANGFTATFRFHTSGSSANIPV